MFGGISKNFWGLQVCFLMDWKVASKKCVRFLCFTLLTSRPELFCKKMYLKVLQISQEHTSARVSFLIKLQSWGLKLYLKRDFVPVFSCEICKIFKNTFFYWTSLVAASPTPKKYCMWIQTSCEINHKIPILNLFLIMILKKNSFLMQNWNLLWIISNFSQFHEHISEVQ